MSISSTTSQSTKAVSDANAFKYLTFCLGNEHYGIPILRVREIIGMIPITPLPRTPEYVRGVMNLRGRIIPVIDLRTRFGLAAGEATKESCIIIVDAHESETEQLLTGIVVDTVHEVQDIAAESITPPPEFGAAVPLDYVRAMGKAKDHVVVLLDIAEVLGAKVEMPPAESAAPSAEPALRKAA